MQFLGKLPQMDDIIYQETWPIMKEQINLKINLKNKWIRYHQIK